jgi:hypothetical protein
MGSRYIIWQEGGIGAAQAPVRDLLSDFPEVRVLRSSDPNHAVVQMDLETEVKIREEHPGLSIEPDVQYKWAAGR